MRKAIRKLDKLNPTMSGVFNPNGLEIISNSEVWDLRTFHLLKTVPGLDQCRVSLDIKLNKKIKRKIISLASEKKY